MMVMMGSQHPAWMTLPCVHDLARHCLACACPCLSAGKGYRVCEAVPGRPELRVGTSISVAEVDGLRSVLGDKAIAECFKKSGGLVGGESQSGHE